MREEKKRLPEGWRWVKVGDICDFQYGSSLTKNMRQGGEVPVYGSNGIVGYHNSSLTSGSTIIIGRKGSVGEIHFSPVPCYPIDTTYYIEKTKVPIDINWLAYFFKILNLPNLNKASGIPGLNRNDAYKLLLPLPPLSEQKRIAAILQEKLAAVEKARKAAEEQLATINALPSAILRQAFNGEL